MRWGQSRKSRQMTDRRLQKQKANFVTVPSSTETCSLGQAACVSVEMWAKVFLLRLLLGKFDIVVKVFGFCGGLAFSGQSRCTKRLFFFVIIIRSMYKIALHCLSDLTFVFLVFSCDFCQGSCIFLLYLTSFHLQLHDQSTVFAGEERWDTKAKCSSSEGKKKNHIHYTLME